MNITLAIKELREKIIAAVNESQLPASILDPVLNSIYLQIAQAARLEEVQAEAMRTEAEAE